jgi:CHAT domain-containing protein
LHLSTHGFYLPEIEHTLQSEEEYDANFLPISTPQVVQIENPLLRSGLALAGFNERKSGEENGMLTALEVAGLDLWGTQLVVLSACETALGDIDNGEGVYGLRRSLTLAGSQSQVMSLWKVLDKSTQELIESYYEKLITDGLGRHEALQQAQLAMLKQEDYKHPHHWAAFIASGDWTPIQVD